MLKVRTSRVGIFDSVTSHLIAETVGRQEMLNVLRSGGRRRIQLLDDAGPDDLFLYGQADVEAIRWRRPRLTGQR